jgi:hypothetical protein
VVVGEEAAVTRLMDSTLDRFDPAAVWGDGWNAVRGGTMTFFAPGLAQVPSRFWSDLGMQGPPPFRRLGAVLEPAGTMALVADMEDPAALSRALAASQQALRAAMAEGLSELVDQLAPFRAWVELHEQTFWSHLDLQTSGNLVTLRTRPSNCGGSLMISALGAAALGAGIALPPTTVPLDIPAHRVAANCQPLAGPPIGFPLQLARVIDPATTSGAAWLLVDFAGLVRQIVPSAAGLLPWALTAEDIQRVLPPASVGLSAWDAPNQPVVAVVQNTQPIPIFFAAMPTALHAFVPAGTIPFPATAIEGVGTVYAMGDSNAMLQRTWDPGTPLGQTLAALPPQAAMVLAVNGAALRDPMVGLLTGGAAQEPIFQTLQSVEDIGVSLDLVHGIRVAAFVREDAPGTATRLSAQIREAVEAMYRELLPGDVGASVVTRLQETVLRTMQVRAEGNVLVLDLLPAHPQGQVGAGPALGIVGALAIIGMRTGSALSGFGEPEPAMPGMPVPFDADPDDPRSLVDGAANWMVAHWGAPEMNLWGKQEPQRFGHNVALYPTREMMQQACAQGGQATRDFTGWTQRFDWMSSYFPPSRPVGMEIEASGVGDDARFTVRVHYDLDCDGQFGILERRGSVQNGMATAAPRVSIAED